MQEDAKALRRGFNLRRVFLLRRLKKLKIPVRNQGGRNWIVRDDKKPDEIIEVDVIGYNQVTEEYLVKIPESVPGFIVSQFHILHYEVAEKHLGQRFNSYYVPRKRDS